MTQIIECVPNYSEGRNKTVIDAIVKAISSVEGIKVLDVDPGEATNRTVVTFVGAPDDVCEAAFRGSKKAQELIDMRVHHGAHPRSGATDVLPLIPVSGISLEECAALARSLAGRLYKELGIACYLYEAAALKPERRNLAVCREGEYEALPEKMADPARKPDFGESFDSVAEKSGATNVGARNFLIAVNFNLNTTSTRRAMAVAFDVREKGRKGPDGNWTPGTLKGTKAIGWYIDEYGIAQVSMNITDIKAVPLHVAFEEVSRAAAARGLRVTGAEIVGLVPKKVLIDAGRFYLEKQQRSLGISEDEIIRIAVKSMSLDDLKPFNPKEKVIEMIMADDKKDLLKNMSLEGFIRETASESAAPGGGSVSAAMGAFGAALATMVANLSAHKRGWDHRWKEFSDVAEAGQRVLDELIGLIDEDTAAFNRIMACYAMPKGTPEEQEARSEAIEEATLNAAMVPLSTMEASLKALPLALQMAREGNPASASDAGVAALAAVAAIKGARLNVRINAASLKDKKAALPLLGRADEIVHEAENLEAMVLSAVEREIQSLDNQ